MVGWERCQNPASVVFLILLSTAASGHVYWSPVTCLCAREEAIGIIGSTSVRVFTWWFIYFHKCENTATVRHWSLEDSDSTEKQRHQLVFFSLLFHLDQMIFSAPAHTHSQIRYILINFSMFIETTNVISINGKSEASILKTNLKGLQGFFWYQ